jgi:hypothetical protein
MNPHRDRRLAALILIAAMALAGCASATGPANGTGIGGGPSPTPSIAPSMAPAACASPLTGEQSVSEKDSGRTICLAVGAKLDVYLHGTAAHKWTQIEASGAALQPAPNGKGTLVLGVTGGFFAASAPGTIVLTSTGPGCGSAGPSSASPCPTAGAFRLTVVVP